MTLKFIGNCIFTLSEDPLHENILLLGVDNLEYLNYFEISLSHGMYNWVLGVYNRGLTSLMKINVGFARIRTIMGYCDAN